MVDFQRAAPGETLDVLGTTNGVLDVDYASCRLKFDVRGTVATMRPNQDCMAQVKVDSNVGTFFPHLSKFTLSLESNPVRLIANVEGKSELPLTCDYSASGSLAR